MIEGRSAISDWERLRDNAGCMRPSAYYDRAVDVMEELFKFTLLLRGRADYLNDRYSERNERARKAIDRQIEKL